MPGSSVLVSALAGGIASPGGAEGDEVLVRIGGEMYLRGNRDQPISLTTRTPESYIGTLRAL